MEINIKTSTVNPVIRFDETKLRAFTKAYEQAKKDNEESFWFEEQEVLTAYAKYVIEYVQTQLDNRKVGAHEEESE